jgi:hypothetical protein
MKVKTYKLLIKIIIRDPLHLQGVEENIGTEER